MYNGPLNFGINATRQGFKNAHEAQGFENTCKLTKLGKLYINSHEPSILFISLPIYLLFKLAIITLVNVYVDLVVFTRIAGTS